MNYCFRTIYKNQQAMFCAKIAVLFAKQLQELYILSDRMWAESPFVEFVIARCSK